MGSEGRDDAHSCGRCCDACKVLHWSWFWGATDGNDEITLSKDLNWCIEALIGTTLTSFLEARIIRIFFTWNTWIFLHWPQRTTNPPSFRGNPTSWSAGIHTSSPSVWNFANILVIWKGFATRLQKPQGKSQAWTKKLQLYTPFYTTKFVDWHLLWPVYRLFHSFRMSQSGQIGSYTFISKRVCSDVET